MKYILLSMFFFLLGTVCMAQSVSNARFVQEGNMIKIYYDLSTKSDISFYLSTDGGKSFEPSPLTNITGAVGQNVSAGKSKSAVWDVLASREKLQAEEVCFKIKASSTSTSNSKSVSTYSPKDYVDLGLPSKTRWKKENEDGVFYSYDEAISRFGNKMPSKEQFDELVQNCSWTWDGNGYKVTGPNGKSIMLPAAGYRGCHGTIYGEGACGNYWTSKPFNTENAYGLVFNSVGFGVDNYYQCGGHSVRLVHK